jgi:hypothetical protein
VLVRRNIDASNAGHYVSPSDERKPGILQRRASNIKQTINSRQSTLTLLVAGIRANHAHNAITTDDLTVTANFLYRRTNFHL